MFFSAYTDASSDNPGLSVVGAILQSGQKLKQTYTKIYSNLTSNEAEYCAIILALEAFLEHRKNEWDSLTIFTDSGLVANQLNGTYTVRSPRIKKYHDKVKEIIKNNNIDVKFTYIPRSLNKEIDKVVRELYQKEKGGKDGRKIKEIPSS